MKLQGINKVHSCFGLSWLRKPAQIYRQHKMAADNANNNKRK